MNFRHALRRVDLPGKSENKEEAANFIFPSFSFLCLQHATSSLALGNFNNLPAHLPERRDGVYLTAAFSLCIRKLHFAMVLRAIMRTWSDVTKAYSATAMSLLQEYRIHATTKRRVAVLAYICLRASCSLRTHVRTATFRRFTRRMNTRVIPS